MSFKRLASQRMFQPVSRVTENEIREDVQQMAFGIWVDTRGSTSSDFGAFPWSVSKTEGSLQAFHMCSARAVDTWVSATDFLNPKKMTRVELNSWIDLLLCLLEKLPSCFMMFQNVGDGDKALGILNLYTLKMLD